MAGRRIGMHHHSESDNYNSTIETRLKVLLYEASPPQETLI
jgi:hypothetical protein